MKIKGFLAFATGTVASMLCMPVVAEETGGIDIAALLANINVGALLASAPDLFAAAIQSAGVILQALSQLVSAVLTNGFDLDAIFAEIVTVVGEAAVNLVAIVGATAANVLFSAGLLPVLNGYVTGFLTTLNSTDISFFHDMSDRVLVDGVTSGTCEDTSYTFNFTDVMLGGFTSLEIAKLTINDQDYVDNGFNGDFGITVDKFDLITEFKGTIVEDKCGVISTEDFDASQSMLNAEVKSNFLITGTVEGQDFTLTNVTIVVAELNGESEEVVLIPLEKFTDTTVSTALKEILEEDMAEFYAKVEADYLNGFIQDFSFPYSFTLPFPWPF